MRIISINSIEVLNNFTLFISIISIYLFKPYVIGLIIYMLLFYYKLIRLNIIEILLTIILIYHFGLVLDICLDFISSTFVGPKINSDYIMHITDNTNNTNTNNTNNTNTNNTNNTNTNSNINNQLPYDNIPRNINNTDSARLIRYLVGNIAALTARRPAARLTSFFVTNVTNVLIDIASNEERANY
jgi:hypothetical protein